LTLQVDDDTVCAAGPCPVTKSGLTLTSQYDPTDMWFPPEFEERSLQQAENDIFQLHTQYLGGTLRDHIDRHAPDQIDLQQLGPSFFHKLHPDGGSVLVSSMGISGDSGTASTWSLMCLDESMRARLVSSESQYRHAMANHQVVRCATSATIGDRTYISGANMGLDNRRLLPPFMPVQRSQDSIFCSMVHASNAGYFAHLPWVLEHTRASRWQHDIARQAGGLLSGRIILALVQRFTPMRHKTTEANLLALGRYLEELGSLPLDEFEDVVRQAAWSIGLDQISTLEGLLRRYGRRPDYWARDLQQYIDAKRLAMPTAHHHIPADLIEAFGLDQARTMTPRLVRRLGQLLQVWPELRNTARELQFDGCPVDVAI
jgi:hypothetical protein